VKTYDPVWRFGIDRAVDWRNRTALVECRNMRTAVSNRWAMRIGLMLWVVWGALCTVSAAGSATNIPGVQPLPGSPRAPISIDVSRLLFSPGVGDIVKMASAGVDASVIKGFIEQARVSYHPAAQEIILLKRLGVANDVVIAMLAHRPRQTDNPRLSVPVPSRSAPQLPDQTPAEPGWPWYALASRYPVNPYAGSPLVAPYQSPYFAFGPLSSFNNSYPTFVNGQAVYAGYYVPTYRVLW